MRELGELRRVLHDARLVVGEDHASSAVSSRSAAATASGSRRPSASTATRVTATPSSRARAAARRRRMLDRRRHHVAARAAASTPRSAMLFASVAPDVKITSRAAAPTSSATCSRARSSAARAAAPSACVLDGLPSARAAPSPWPPPLPAAAAWWRCDPVDAHRRDERGYEARGGRSTAARAPPRDRAGCGPRRGFGRAVTSSSTSATARATSGAASAVSRIHVAPPADP